MEKRRLLGIVPLAGIGLFLALRSALAPPDGTPPAVAAARQRNTPVNTQLVTADNTFGLHLFAQLTRENADRNVFISPASVALALQMVYNGARGETRQAMEKTLALQGVSLQEVNQANAALLAALQNPDPNVQLSIADSLWMRADAPVAADFAQRNTDFYGAQIGDLAKGPAAINAWVSQATHGKISQIVQGNDLERAFAVLLNAIYFKGSWTTPFEDRLTHPGPFTLPDGRQKDCQMMHQSGSYPYFKGPNFQAVRLPYGKGRMSFLIFLPDSGVPMSTFLAGLTPESFAQWQSEFKPMHGDITLPRFRTEYGADLNAPLSSLGMGVAFDRNAADFGGMLPGGRFYISLVRHKTYVEVNEQGTEAAAATGVVMKPLALIRGFQFVVDHPFVCAIHDEQTGAILFLGCILDPPAV
ncbi:MAG TPA: serpin family protein [Chthonomonadaceae bacterium]|nr:serpin family protein [Chthonomonadaceae bacterium]